MINCTIPLMKEQDPSKVYIVSKSGDNGGAEESTEGEEEAGAGR